jgi:hypothetical protein
MRSCQRRTASEHGGSFRREWCCVHDFYVLDGAWGDAHRDGCDGTPADKRITAYGYDSSGNGPIRVNHTDSASADGNFGDDGVRDINARHINRTDAVGRHEDLARPQREPAN